MLFSVENDQKYMWVGQVKTGSWDYCLKGIKEYIAKSVLRNYFSSAIVIMADIMRATSGVSDELEKIIDDLNNFCLEYPKDLEALYTKVHDYFATEGIIIRVPCLIIADESEYSNEAVLLDVIKAKCHEAFSSYSYDCDGLNVEVLLLVLPVRNLDAIRKEFLKLRKSQ